MAWRSKTAVAVAALVLLVACERNGASTGKEGQAPSAAVAAADPCAGATDEFGKTVCADPSFQPLLGDIKAGLSEAVTAVSEEGVKEIAEAQDSWLKSTQAACGVETPGAMTPEQQDCVRMALTTRVKEAKAYVRKEGGFTFRTAEINDADAVSKAVASELGLLESQPAAVEKRIRFPQLEGDSPQVKRFNKLMEQRAEVADGDQTSEYVDYAIAYADDGLVSVRFNRSDFALGSARPSNAAKVVTVVMATGEPLSAEDVFAVPEAQWKPVLVRKARAGLLQQLRTLGADLNLPANDVADTASKVRNWIITKDALVVLFPPESIGPHALGELEVAIPWSELKPLLNPQGPGPIGAR